MFQATLVLEVTGFLVRSWDREQEWQASTYILTLLEWQASTLIDFIRVAGQYLYRLY